ncbi:branched chain amino acid aminotransferase [Lysobacter pythonis]|uniref:Branched chain amino acid aminotransferase n=1 Tax=Solilutibacter pythonis TaxID=2483112 RepID=A0A3M2HXX2_9GAMM|nr:aminotransferase class IV [Lysobacter pythonis]RMH93105.1 branched chain amino acid aminotransferase [Lysobacter pythonis]
MSVSALPRGVARPKIWFDGALVDADAAATALDSHALHYGSGVFEGIKSYATVHGATAVFRLPEHLERMRRGAELLGLDFDAGTTAAAIVATLRANGHRDAYIRPLAWAGSGGFGLDTAGHPSHCMVATTETLVHLNGARVRCAVSTRRRNPVAALPTLKLCGGYVNSILAKREAARLGCNEALFVDDEGFVVECTGANVFMVKDGRISAATHRDALPGITRDSLIALTGAQSRPIPLDELLEADEVFACGTAAEVAPLATLGQREYADGPITREIAALYARAVRGEESAHRHWLTEFRGTT